MAFFFFPFFPGSKSANTPILIATTSLHRTPSKLAAKWPPEPQSTTASPEPKPAPARFSTGVLPWKSESNLQQTTVWPPAKPTSTSPPPLSPSTSPSGSPRMRASVSFPTVVGGPKASSVSPPTARKQLAAVSTAPAKPISPFAPGRQPEVTAASATAKPVTEQEPAPGPKPVEEPKPVPKTLEEPKPAPAKPEPVLVKAEPAAPAKVESKSADASPKMPRPSLAPIVTAMPAPVSAPSAPAATVAEDKSFEYADPHVFVFVLSVPFFWQGTDSTCQFPQTDRGQH